MYFDVKNEPMNFDLSELKKPHPCATRRGGAPDRSKTGGPGGPQHHRPADVRVHHHTHRTPRILLLWAHAHQR